MGPILSTLGCHPKLRWFPIKDTARRDFLWNFNVSSAGQTDFNHTDLRLLFSILVLRLPTEGQVSNFFSLFLNTSAAVVEQTIVLLSLTQLLPGTDRACSSCSRTLTGRVNQNTSCHFFILKDFFIEFYTLSAIFLYVSYQYFKLQNYTSNYPFLCFDTWARHELKKSMIRQNTICNSKRDRNFIKAEAEASLGATGHLTDKHLGSCNFWPYIRLRYESSILILYTELSSSIHMGPEDPSSRKRPKNSENLIKSKKSKRFRKCKS